MTVSKLASESQTSQTPTGPLLYALEVTQF